MMRNVVLVLVSAGFLWFAHRAFKHWLMRRRILAKAKHGRRVEDQAGVYLAKHGYQVIEQHPKMPYSWRLDGEEMTVNAAPDWHVYKDGKTYLVEVKTGGQANPRSAKVRRQLLEYYLYGDADGVIYLDGDRGQILTVTFPTPIRVRTPLWVWPTLIALGALSLFSLWKWWNG